MRELPRRDYVALKKAFRELVERAGGPQLVATRTRGNASLLSRYCAEHEAMFAPLDVVADVEAIVGEPLVSRLLAEMSGQTLVAKSAAGQHAETFASHLGAVARATGEAVGALAALAEGVAGPTAAMPCLKALRDAQQTYANAEQDVQRVIAEAPFTLVQKRA